MGHAELVKALHIADPVLVAGPDCRLGLADSPEIISSSTHRQIMGVNSASVRLILPGDYSGKSHPVYTHRVHTGMEQIFLSSCSEKTATSQFRIK